jgi:hypothetical protein
MHRVYYICTKDAWWDDDLAHSNQLCPQCSPVMTAQQSLLGHQLDRQRGTVITTRMQDAYVGTSKKPTNCRMHATQPELSSHSGVRSEYVLSAEATTNTTYNTNRRCIARLCSGPLGGRGWLLIPVSCANVSSATRDKVLQTLDQARVQCRSLDCHAFTCWSLGHLRPLPRAASRGETKDAVETCKRNVACTLKLWELTPLMMLIA